MGLVVSGILAPVNKYELTLLFPEGEAGSDKKKVMKIVEDFVASKKGKVEKHESWGVKTLAYQIQRNSTGEYEHYVIELKPKHQPELSAQLKLEEGLLRYLFVRV